jgi:hypothetical protein
MIRTGDGIFARETPNLALDLNLWSALVKKIVLTFGLIAGVILSVLMVITFALRDQIGFDNGMVVGYTTMVASLLMVYVGIRTYRDTVLGGRIRFWPAVKVGLLISLIATVFYVATWEAMYYRFMPNYMKEYAAHSIEKARNAGASAADLAKQQKEFDEFEVMYRNPLVNIGFTMLEPSPIVLLVTLVSAGLLSRRKEGDVVSPDGMSMS